MVHDKGDDMNERTNVLERMLQEGFATGNTDIVDELCDPGIVEH